MTNTFENINLRVETLSNQKYDKVILINKSGIGGLICGHI